MSSSFFKTISLTQNYAQNKKLLLEYLIGNGQDPDKFFDDNLRNLPDFSTLLDIELAAKRVIEAVDKNQKIGLFGDYDADGTTSVALFYHFLKMLGVEAVTYQPSRFIEGYGLHKSSIETALADKVDLLITFDCGIMNHASAEFAKEVDLDLIITDHHNDGSKEKPCAYAVVNPNRTDQPESELKKLAGVGVSFALAHEVKRLLGREMPSIYPLLQFAAIGTVGDMVPLNPMNLKIVRHGLKQFPKSDYPAIKAFFKMSDFPEATSEFIGFKVAPLINAKGRLEGPEEALNLLKASTDKEAISLLAKLQATNEERKKVQSSNAIIARNKIKKHKFQDHRILVLFNAGFHQGVIGLVASTMVKELKRPAIVMTKDEGKPGILKASVRTVGHFDIFNFLNSLDFPFVTFGGHKKAAGFSIKEEDLVKFQECVAKASEKLVILADEIKGIKVDCKELDMHLAVAQRELEPFGEGNPRPLFEIEGVVEKAQTLKEKHLRIYLEGHATPFLLFNYYDSDWNGGKLKDSHIPGRRVSILTTCKLGFYNNSYKIDLLIEELRFKEKEAQDLPA